jgi:hypothetical protein
MFRSAVLFLVLLAAPAVAQSQTTAQGEPDCTADIDLADALKLDVQYRCRSATALTFAPAGRVEPRSGLVEARYHIDLRDRQGADPRELILRGDGALATLGMYLAEPRGYDHLPVIDIRVRAAKGLAFAAGLPKVGDGWRLAGSSVAYAGYSALGKVSLQDIAVPAPGSLRSGLRSRELRPEPPRDEGVLHVAILDGVSDGSNRDLVDWVRRTAEAEANYWQGFTARHMLVGLVPTGTRGPAGYGRTVSGGGASVMVEVGRQVDRRRLFNDWVLVHELVHTGMPYLMRRATWFMEGAATYAEPVIRARAGWKSEEEVWKEWLDNMPRGQDAFARGLMNASGRENYWSGALFMLIADIELRRRTDGERGLEDCLAGALWSGLDATQRVAVQDYAAACDRAAGTTAVSDLLVRYYARGEVFDLAAYWTQLGVALVDGRVVLDDAAPLARWRRLIVPGSSSRPPRPVKLPWQS